MIVPKIDVSIFILFQKEEFISYLLGYLPTLKLPLDKTQEFVSALQADNKNFRAYLKVS